MRPSRPKTPYVSLVLSSLLHPLRFRAQNNTTLYIGGLTAEITEEDLRDKFYLFGEIKSIRLAQKSLCAFITFVSRAAAEKAVEVTHHALNIKGKNLKVSWGRPQTLDPSAQTRTQLTPR